MPVDLQRRVLRRASAVLLQEGAGDDVIGDGGVGKVRWVSIDVTAGEQEPSGDDRSSVMPLFPLGAAYLPHTSPVINIFEPRYRAMCVLAHEHMPGQATARRHMPRHRALCVPAHERNAGTGPARRSEALRVLARRTGTMTSSSMVRAASW